MRFVFKCLAVRHASGRVSLTPLGLPDLAVHATDVVRAVEELTLALDDRLARAHPRRVAELLRPAAGELAPLDVPLIDVWHERGEDKVALRLSAVVAPAHKPFTEVHLPRAHARFWLPGKAIMTAAAELAAEHLEGEDPDDLLALRSEGAESLLELVLEATPARLSDLRRSELGLDERAPARARTADGDADGGDDSDADEVLDLDADWDDDRPRKRRRRAAGKPPARPPTPTLKKIGVAWHQLVADDALAPAFEVDELVADLAARVAATAPDPLVLVGPSGAGKTAILHALARSVCAGGKPGEVAERRPFFFVDASRLIAGEGVFGDWQRQTLDAWREAHAAKAVLCLGRVRDLLEAGKSAHSDQNVAQLLAPALAAREVAVIAEATVEEWAEVERRQEGFARAFAVLRVEDPPPARSEKILARVAERLAAEREVKIAPGAVAEALSLCARFAPYGALVGNAVALLTRVIDARAHALAAEAGAADVLALWSAETGIPEVLLVDELPLDEDETRAFLAARVHGQPAAVARAARAVTLIKANLADRRRPSAVLFFAGPTGVGKTELCKALAENVFGTRERLVRLDMGEFAGPDALARLIGDGAHAGHLADAVRRQPFSLVLLDEIEKAHPVVFDALLGVLGEGRLTDGRGRLTDFRSTIIVMTSNLGAETLRARPGFGGAATAESSVAHYRAEVQRFFRPELFNRLDDVVVFAPLGAPELASIVDRELDAVVVREGLRRRDVRLEVDAGARAFLAARGHDPRYGARPLKRAIEARLVAPVAAWLAEHPAPGALRLAVSAPVDGAAAGDALVLEATSTGGLGDGGSRQGLVRLLEDAGEQRALVRRLGRSGPMRRLRQELGFFDRLSRQPSFWAERGLADESARAAAEGRELDRAFGDLERQAEAIEDLVYEAYYGRQGAAVEILERDLAAVIAALAPLKLRLFASLFPPRNRVALWLLPGRGGWAELCFLTDAYRAFLQAHGAQVKSFALIEKAAKAPPKGTAAAAAASAAAAGKKGKKSAGKPGRVEYKWHERALFAGDPDHPVAAVLEAGGAPAIMLLAAEHGVHRFMAGGQTTVVSAAFVPRPAPNHVQPGLDELELVMPRDDIRRVWLDKKVVRDLRFRPPRSFHYTGAALDLAPVYDAYLDLRLLGAEAAE